MNPAHLRRCAELLRSGEARAEIVAGEIDDAANALDRLQATHRLIARTEAGECWHWQGDGHDYPDSLACPVVIDDCVLRRLLRDAGRYRWLRKDFTRLIVSTARDQAADDDRLFVVDIQVSKHLRTTDASSVDAAVDAAMPSARAGKRSQHLPAATDADAIGAAAKLACGLLWMTAEWRTGKTEAAYQALLEAVGGSGSQGLRDSIQSALDAGHEVGAPPGCYWPGE